ncbi:S1/P1 Nuclease [Phenylobacterium aquaticum]|uniref:S1/P1 Nuclease n=1 Tax=Phenylobacterium aquaticum TaxID=1763816 RepID=UPI0026ED7C9E|nr:S1/P1 Nuclease [Phenylobacterium aquaticum]
MSRRPLIAQIVAAIIAGLGLVAATSAHAWGTRGHEWITGLAIERLPPALPGFLRTPQAAEDMAVISREPDRWRASGQAHDAERDPGHYIHVDDAGLVLGVTPFAALPPTREAFDTGLRVQGADQYQAGYLPYAINDGWQQLVRDFALWRVERVGARTAKSPADRAWFTADLKRREALTIRDLGVWSHYVGDAANPMHVSTHYVGWGAGPNPKGYSNAKDLHWRFEAIFVKANLDRAQVAPLLKPYRDCACAIGARTTAYLDASRAQVIALYDLEAADGFGKAVTPQSRAFVLARLAAGSDELRDMIMDAWMASATAEAAPGVKVADVEAGKLVVTRALFGDE